MSLLLSASAAFAADDDAAKKTDEAPAKTEPASKPEPAKVKEEPKKETKDAKGTKEKKPKAASSDGGAGGVAAHIGSFVAGTFVGVPVSIFRKSKTESINATKDLIGDTDNKFLWGTAGILGVPAGILSGAIQGLVYGPLNAYRGTKDEPFSPEAFSLGDSK